MSITTRFITRTSVAYPSLYRAFCTGFITLLLAGASYADIYLPSGLNPGDKYRIAFVTSVIRDAQSSNINDYNSFVNSAANVSGTLTAPLGTTWTAIASTATVDARDNTSTNPSSTGLPIFLVDGTTKIAANNSDFWDGTLLSPISLTEFGNATSNLFVWTGSSPSGQAQVPLGGLGATLGNTSFANSFWVTYATTGTENASYFYGISGELTAHVVPEPSALLGLAMAVTGLLGLRSPRRR